MKVLHSRRVARARRGMALMVVLLVLLALLVLCAPFLASARDADRASSVDPSGGDSNLGS